MFDAVRAFDVVRDLTTSYPDFANWFVNKALPDAVVGDGVMIIAEQGDEIVGVGLGKRKAGETKLRCVRVVPRLQGRGVGIHIIDKVLKEIGCDRPLATVPQDMLHDFSRILVNRFAFDLTSVEKNLYGKGRHEYVFNGAEADLRASSPY